MVPCRVCWPSMDELVANSSCPSQLVQYLTIHLPNASIPVQLSRSTEPILPLTPVTGSFGAALHYQMGNQGTRATSHRNEWKGKNLLGPALLFYIFHFLQKSLLGALVE